MAIWFNKNLSVQDFGQWGKNTLAEHLDMKFTELGDNYLKATMPVNNTTQQPYGLLHGGASVALAETVGSPFTLVIQHMFGK